MKQNFLTRMLLLVAVVLMGAGTVSAADKWVKTAPADLATGDIVVIVDQNSSTAMSNNNGTSSAPSATSVTLKSDNSEITSEVAATLQWEVTVNNGSYQFGVAGSSNYLYATATNNGLRVGTNTNNSFTIYDNNGVDFLFINTTNNKNQVEDRYIGVYNNQDWRCYTSINNNIKNTVTAFYKKVADSSGKTDVASLTSISPTSVDVDDNGTFTLTATFADGLIASDYDVTWASSDENVLYVEAATGEYLAGSDAGTVTITVTVTPDDNTTYQEVSKDFTVTVVDPNAPGSENNPFTVADAISAINNNTYDASKTYYISGIVSSFYNTSIVGDGTNYRYYISDDGTTTNQLLVYKGKGLNNVEFSNVNDLLVGDEVVICGKLTLYNSTPEINSGNYIVSFNRPAVKQDAGLEYDPAAYEVMLGDAFSAPTLTNPNNLTVTFESSNTSVATVDENTGVVTIVAIGTTTITASFAGNDSYYAGDASYTLTVKKPVVLLNGYFQKVTATTDITDGKYLIVYEDANVAFDGGLEKLDAVGDVVDVTINNGVIAADATTSAAYFEIDVKNGSIQSFSGYYIGVTSYSNGLAQSETSSYTNALSIDEDKNVVITVTTTGGDMTLRFNSASNQNRFRYYKSGQQAIQLYKFIPFTKAITATGWATYIAPANVAVPTGVTAYIVSATSATSATLTKIEDGIPADEPVLLNGAEDTYEFARAATVDDCSTNILEVSDATTGNGVYVLASKTSNGVGFYKWNGGLLGAGRVYLPAPAVGGAREFIGFDEETTGIENVNAIVSLNGEVFDLQGRRVAQPQKGLYIVNGKKVVIK